MSNVRHGTLYRKMAAWAAAEAGVAPPTAEAGAENPAAREIRDAIWAEYESRLRDTQTYTLKAIAAWLRETTGIDAKTMAVHRDRKPVLARQRALELTIADVRNFLEATRDASEAEIMEAARRRAGDQLFQLLMQARVDRPDTVDPKDLIRWARAVADLSAAGASTRLSEQRLAEMRKAARAEAEREAEAAPDGRLSKTEVLKIIDAAMKGEAA